VAHFLLKVAILHCCDAIILKWREFLRNWRDYPKNWRDSSQKQLVKTKKRLPKKRRRFPICYYPTLNGW